MYKLFFKRLMDVFLSICGILFLAPIFLLIILILYFVNKGNPFFIQTRPGRNQVCFKLYKFKTMNDKKSEDGQLLSDSERITFIGKIIRKTSLDELPQLFNVLIGDMSLIGPRPLLPQYLSLYNETQKRRHLVKPGITGWAQVNGRNAISWEQKFEYDVWYVDNFSFFLDAKILFKTVSKVIMFVGVNLNEEITMEIFKGNN